MNLPVYLTGLFLSILLAGGCLAAILIYFDPHSSGLLVFLLFYLSLFISSTSVFTSVGFLIRRFSYRGRMSLPVSRVVRQLMAAFRQGFLLSIILVVSLILQSQRVLVWWHLLILVFLVGLVEWWLAKR